MADKIEWEGDITSVQPRIRLNRSFDERNHSYMGFSLRVEGRISGSPKIFWVGIGKAAQSKHQFQTGVSAQGKGHYVADPRTETVELYKVSGLGVSNVMEIDHQDIPPWHGIPISLEQYRQRGHRRLSSRTYQSKCSSCIWGCQMPVILAVDHWNPSQKQFRVETFCYGPKSCGLYHAGPTRTVPGRKGMTWEEDDSVDEEATAHRGPDD